MEFIQWGIKRFALSKDPSGFYVENGLECGKMELKNERKLQ